jgi:hypothetical protein
MNAPVKTTATLPETVTALGIALEAAIARIAALEATKTTGKSEKEMTDADAHSVLTGECKDLKHNDAAKKLGLSYGQVYSCRGEYTFRHIHKAMKEAGTKNPWKK